jgi:hypothetical protein
MRETVLKYVSYKQIRVEVTTHNLRGFGKKLMNMPNFTTLAAKAVFKV